MDVDNLVKLITQKVLEQLQGASTSTYASVLAPRTPSLSERLSMELAPGTVPVFLGETLPAGRTPTRHILPELACTDMAGLAAGAAPGPVAALVLERLLAGQKVEVLEFEYRRYHKTAPSALYALYESYAQQLQSFGLVPFTTDREHDAIFRETLVTQAHVLEAKHSGASALVVPVSALVTPAAVDAAKELNFVIKKRL